MNAVNRNPFNDYHLFPLSESPTEEGNGVPRSFSGDMQMLLQSLNQLPRLARTPLPPFLRMMVHVTHRKTQQGIRE
jgi:hypothetical protein